MKMHIKSKIIHFKFFNIYLIFGHEKHIFVRKLQFDLVVSDFQ